MKENGKNIKSESKWKIILKKGKKLKENIGRQRKLRKILKVKENERKY